MVSNPVRIDHITSVRKASNALITAIDSLRALKNESDALDLGSTFSLDDFKNDNGHLTKEDIIAVTGTTLTAIEALMIAGHATNLYKVKA